MYSHHYLVPPFVTYFLPSSCSDFLMALSLAVTCSCLNCREGSVPKWFFDHGFKLPTQSELIALRKKLRVEGLLPEAPARRPRDRDNGSHAGTSAEEETRKITWETLGYDHDLNIDPIDLEGTTLSH